MMPPPPKPKAAPPRTLLSEDRGEVAAALLEHLGDEDAATELLDAAQLYGDAQTTRAKAEVAGDSWLVEMFGPPAAEGGEAA